MGREFTRLDTDSQKAIQLTLPNCSGQLAGHVLTQAVQSLRVQSADGKETTWPHGPPPHIHGGMSDMWEINHHKS